MTFWLGILSIAEAAGLVTMLAAVKTSLCVSFPTIPVSDPAAGSVLLNLSANMLGLARRHSVRSESNATITAVESKP